jgi:1-hydroxycarotenoid 3,4-desaturase
VSHIVVVGAGMGGLAAAIDLARSGHQVTVLERAAAPGGKLRALEVDGTAIDAGPTVFTMRWVLESLLADAGLRLDDLLTLDTPSVLARHAWRADAVLDIHADVERSVAAIREFSGAKDAAGYRDFCRRSAELYEALHAPFMTAQRPTPLQLVTRLGATGLASMWRTAPWTTLWRSLADHFDDVRLRQLFGRYATYVGSSPFAAPATLMLIAHVEREGVCLVRGGMRQVAAALEHAGRSVGAAFRYHTHVAEILLQQGRACGVRLETGERIAADAIVFNGDANALANGLLGDEARAAVPPVTPRERSLSAVTWCLHAPARGFPLEHHNVFFGDDYEREFRAVFDHGRIAEEPTVYLCAQDRGVTDRASPTHRERMLLLVNAPADGDGTRSTERELSAIERRTFAVLERCGLTFERRSDDCVVTTPTAFERAFPGSGGALYGRANHGALASFARPPAASKIAGFYLAGGTAHPGAGIPMATLSGRLAAARINAALR